MFRSLLIFLCLSALIRAHADDFQSRIDAATVVVMSSRIGLAICNQILDANPDLIEHNLGVSENTAIEIATSCTDANAPNPWIAPTSQQGIKKLSEQPNSPRRFALAKAVKNSPIESWSQPYTNTTTFIVGPDDVLTQDRLIQLIAHETAIYFDAKVDPTYQDAKKIPQLASLTFVSDPAKIDPKIAIVDPFVANALTYLRSLEVEYAIVDELVHDKKMAKPGDYDEPVNRQYIAETCTAPCVLGEIEAFRRQFKRTAAPLLTLSFLYRAEIVSELRRIDPQNKLPIWSVAGQALKPDPQQYIRQRFANLDPLQSLQNVFARSKEDQAEFAAAALFLDQTWDLERPVLEATKVRSPLLPEPVALLDFLKIPLLSGDNILFAAGPRARMRPGGGGGSQ